MKLGPARAPVWAIWLLIAFGAVQPIVWMVAGGSAPPPVLLIPLLVVWITLLVLAALATRRVSWLSRSLSKSRRAHQATLTEVDQLQTQNAMLQIVARSVDVRLAFQELASRIARLVACDRVGLALLSEDGREFQTYTARVDGEEPRVRTRPEVVFGVERTIIGGVVRSREPFIMDDIREAAPDFLDANLLLSAGFRSGLVVPLISKDRPVGTLNLVSRKPGAFARAHLAPLQPIAELLAVAWVAQQLQMTMGKQRTVEAMSEITLSIASDINSALQTIAGHCDLLARSMADPAVEGDLEMVVSQTKRIAALLEKMRRATAERVKEAGAAVEQKGGLPPLAL